MYLKKLALAAALLWSLPATAEFGFTSPTTVENNVFAPAMAVGDVDGDGRKDIVIAGARSGQSRALLVYRQLENGGFAAPLSYPFGWEQDGLNGPRLVLSDLDSDGDLDFVVTTGDGGGRLVLLRNGGNRVDVVEAVAGAEFSSIVATDANGDGRIDVLTTHFDTDIANVYYGDGSGGITATAYMPLAGNTSVLRLADLDGDGRDDLVYASGGGIFAHRQTGGGFTVVAKRLVGGARSPSSPMAFADFNGDGRLDIVAAGAGQVAGANAVYLQGPGESFGRGRYVPISRSGPLFAQDLDSDGDQDFAVVQTGLPDEVAVFMGTPAGQFEPEQRFLLPTGRSQSVVDVDGDGRSDVVTALLSPNRIAVAYGATTTQAADLAVNLDLSAGAAGVTVRNLGGDTSQAYSLEVRLTARAGALIGGTFPAGCQQFQQNGTLLYFCSFGALAGDGSQSLSFGYASAGGTTQGQIKATARVSMPTPDLRPQNDRATKTIFVP